MSFYFGYQGNLQSVKVPTTGLERTQQAYRASGTLTNGGGWVRSSVGEHYTYAMNWDFLRNEDYAKIRALYDSGELIHFLDPQAAVSNSLPPYIAAAGNAAKGGYRMIGYADAVAISEVSTLAPLVTTGPTRTVRYSAITGAPRKQIWLPVPTGHTLHLRGLTSGTARATLSGSTNLLTAPRLNGFTMAGGGTGVFVDTIQPSDAPDGGSFFRRHVTTPNSTSPMALTITGSGTAALPVVVGRTYTVSWYARKTLSGGPATRADIRWYDAAGVQLSTPSSTTDSVSTGWVRAEKPFVAPANAAFMRVDLVWTGVAITNQDLDFAMAQVEEGGAATTWTDSSLPAYSSGTTVPQISAVAGSAQGTYLTIGAGDNIDIRWLQTQVLPTGQAPVWGDWMPGLGHSGCRLDDVPSYTLYSAPQALDFGALGLTLRETGAWQ